ncbi:MAG: hypothetical protein KQH83_06250 [Actinobacteria bacterium]|nr:hypothetical protein [Actinomycetota bacterium]
MRFPRALLFAVLLVMVAAACGDDAGSTTGPTTPVTTTTSAATTTTAAATTTAAPATTTTAAPTTTTTTLPADAHPYFGISWAAMFPDGDARALYRVEDLGVSADLELRVERGVEFGGGVYDRFVFGEAEPGSVGIAIYVDLSEPWVAGYAGLEVYTAAATNGPDTSEVYAEPSVFDLSAGPGETVHAEGTVQARFGSMTITDDITADLTWREGNAGPITVGAGTFDDVFAFDLVLSGPFMGGDVPVACFFNEDVGLLVVELNGSAYELLEPWG